MPDIFTLGAGGNGLLSQDRSTSGNATLDTGDLRRRYNFGDRVSELNISQDPFFRLVSKVSKKATDDPEFKFTERRPSYHKRYAYPVAYSLDNATWNANYSTSVATQGDRLETAGGTIYVKMAGDYKTEGNLQNVFGNTSGEIVVGATGTQPAFYLEDQLIKVNWSTTSGGLVKTYAILRVDTVTAQAWTSDSTHLTADAQILKCTVVKAKAAASGGTDTNFPAGISANDLSADSVAATAIASDGSSAGL